MPACFLQRESSFELLESRRFCEAARSGFFDYFAVLVVGEGDFAVVVEGRRAVPAVDVLNGRCMKAVGHGQGDMRERSFHESLGKTLFLDQAGWEVRRKWYLFRVGGPD